MKFSSSWGACKIGNKWKKGKFCFFHVFLVNLLSFTVIDGFLSYFKNRQ